LPRDTPSLEMFSNNVETLSLIENKGVLSSVFGFTLSVDLPDSKMTCLSPCKWRCFVPDVTRSVTKSPNLRGPFHLETTWHKGEGSAATQIKTNSE